MQIGDCFRMNKTGITGKIIGTEEDHNDGWGPRLMVEFSPDDIGLLTGDNEDLVLDLGSSYPVKSLERLATKINLSATVF